jgi:hypothetical protein
MVNTVSRKNTNLRQAGIVSWVVDLITYMCFPSMKSTCKASLLNLLYLYLDFAALLSSSFEF